MLKRLIYPYLIYWIHRLLVLTWRVRVIESESFKKLIERNEKAVIAHWHGDDPVVVLLIRSYRVAVMTSTSADGEMMDRIVRLYGARTVRGSSTRGGVGALKGLLKLGKQGFRPSLAVDGPKGPYHQVKPGIFEISRVMNAAVCPLGVAVSACWVFEKSWNKAYLPKPFAKVNLYWGEPMAPITKAQDARDPALAAELAKRIDDCHQAAERALSASVRRF